MECPVCEEDLVIVERHGIELDYCFECHGLWFDSGELTMLAAAMDEDIYLPDILSIPATRQHGLHPHYRCPKCDRKMEKFCMGENDSILLDRCPVGDGLWFEHGELEDVIQYYRSHGKKVTLKKAPTESIFSFVGETFNV